MIIGIIAAIILGTVIFGAVITAAVRPSIPVSTIIDQLSRGRRSTDHFHDALPAPGNDHPTASTTVAGPQLTVDRARRYQAMRALRNFGRDNVSDIHIWAGQVIGHSRRQHLGDLEEELLSAVTHLELGRIDVKKCLDLWGLDNADYGRALCASNNQDFHHRWQATAEPVNNAYVDLRNLCLTSYASAIPVRDTTAPPTDRTVKRSTASHSTVPLVLISPLPAGTAIGFATRRDLATGEDSPHDPRQADETRTWAAALSHASADSAPQVFFTTLR